MEEVLNVSAHVPCHSEGVSPKNLAEILRSAQDDTLKILRSAQDDTLCEQEVLNYRQMN